MGACVSKPPTEIDTRLNSKASRTEFPDPHGPHPSPLILPNTQTSYSEIIYHIATRLLTTKEKPLDVNEGKYIAIQTYIISHNGSLEILRLLRREIYQLLLDHLSAISRTKDKLLIIQDALLRSVTQIIRCSRKDKTPISAKTDGRALSLVKSLLEGGLRQPQDIPKFFSIYLTCLDVLRYLCNSKADAKYLVLIKIPKLVYKLISEIVGLSKKVGQKDVLEFVQRCFQLLLAIGSDGGQGVFNVIATLLTKHFFCHSVVTACLISFMAITSQPLGAKKCCQTPEFLTLARTAADLHGSCNPELKMYVKRIVGNVKHFKEHYTEEMVAIDKLNTTTNEDLSSVEVEPIPIQPSIIMQNVQDKDSELSISFSLASQDLEYNSLQQYEENSSAWITHLMNHHQCILQGGTREVLASCTEFDHLVDFGDVDTKQDGPGTESPSYHCDGESIVVEAHDIDLDIQKHAQEPGKPYVDKVHKTNFELLNDPLYYEQANYNRTHTQQRAKPKYHQHRYQVPNTDYQ